ncbi:MAG: hypothetical protein FWC76_00760 [Defluviitaleaceae bacterium]|nr:hypothetical protein [Defluviitaleaceae bacterium]
MRHSYDDNDFLTKCRDIDLSADSQNYEKNLEVLKGKLAQIEEERYNMNKQRRFKKPIAVAAIIAVMLSFSAVAFAAPAWQYIEFVFVQGAEHVNYFRGMTIAPTTIEYLGDGTSVSRGVVIIESDIDRNADGPIIIDVDGHHVVLQDAHHFYDLNEALNHLAIENPLLPTYLPEDFDFQRATFNISPVRHPDIHSAANNINISYSDGQGHLNININDMFAGAVSATLGYDEDGVSHFTKVSGVEGAGDFDFDYEELVSVHFSLDPERIETIEINGQQAFIGNGRLILQAGTITYILESADLTYEQLIEIAKSLQ